MKRNQKGFGAIEGLLIIIIVLLIGFIAYYVYHTRNNTNSSYNNAAKTSNSTSNKSTTFVFKGLGVGFDPANDLEGLSYKIDSGYYYLSDTAFLKVLETCPDDSPGSGNGGGFAAIGKTSGQAPANPDPVKDGAVLKQFPDFWISYGFPNGLGCSDNTKSQAIHDAGEAEATKFYNDFQKTATLVQ